MGRSCAAYKSAAGGAPRRRSFGGIALMHFRSKPRPAARYALSFSRGAISVDLDVFDRADAFAHAQRLVKDGRPATLFEDGVPLAQISYSPAGFWTVSEEGTRVA